MPGKIVFRTRARGRHKPGQMNSTEKAYAIHLESLKFSGAVEWYAFEAIKFRLADNTFYTPDFIVMMACGALEAHEVKGHWEDDARVKIKVAAEHFPLQFRGFKPRPKREGGGWHEEVF